MKYTVILCIASAVTAFYTDIDENVDIDGIMADPEKVKSYLDCFLNRGPCTATATSYKKHILDFMTTACKECDKRTKHIVEEFLLDVYVQFPEEMAALRDMYDPTKANLPSLVREVSQY